MFGFIFLFFFASIQPSYKWDLRETHCAAFSSGPRTSVLVLLFQRRLTTIKASANGGLRTELPPWVKSAARAEPPPSSRSTLQDSSESSFHLLSLSMAN